MQGMGMYRFLSSSRLLSWMAFLTPVVVLFNGLTIHAWALVALISGLYLVWMASLMFMLFV